VYKGYDSSLDRFVLLKVLRPEYSVHEDVASRFRSEARLLAKVNHPNVVAVYAYGDDDGVTYMTTEFVDGQTLAELVASGPLPPGLAAAVLMRIARGLAASHAEGVLHRDLKPANVLLSEKGQVKLTDFGLAVSEEARGEGPAIAGTLWHMAPEVIGGDPPTSSSDLFAAGTVLFELLTARKAFPGETDSEILDAVLNRSPLHGVESYSDAPSGLLVICSRLLQKDPAKRMQSAEELTEALEAWLAHSGRVITEPDIASYMADPAAWPDARPDAPAKAAAPHSPTAALAGRRPRSTITFVWAAAAAVTVIVLALWMTKPPDRPPDIGAAPDSTVAQVPAENRQPADDEQAVSDEAGDPALPPDSDGTADDRGPAQDPASRLEDLPPAVAENPATEDPMISPIPTDTLDLIVTGSGWLAVAFSPWASIWVDGDSILTASVDTLELSAGRHEVVLRNPDFPPIRRQIEIAAGGTSRLDVSLWSTVARLSLQVVPWAIVEIDGAVVDTIPPQPRPLILAPGPHTLRLIHPEYGEIQRDVVLQAGEHRELAYNMRDASRR
jgi:serine/threonine-protein kinase